MWRHGNLTPGPSAPLKSRPHLAVLLATARASLSDTERGVRAPAVLPGRPYWRRAETNAHVAEKLPTTCERFE